MTIHRPRTTSLRTSLFTSFILLFLYVLLVIVSSIVINYSIHSRFISLVERNDLFAELLTLQVELQDSFQEALRAAEEAEPERWITVNRRVDGLLEQISAETPLTRRGRTHLRVISNIYDYQFIHANRLLIRDDLTPEDYSEISFLTLLLRSMNQETQDLAIVEYKSNMEGFAAYFDRFKRRESIAMVALGFFVLVFGALVIRSINRVLSNTNALIAATSTFDEGAIDQQDFPPTGISEIDAIASSFNTMKHEIHRYIDELREKSQLELELRQEHLENEQKDRRLKQAQLDFLRSQINPHFLFNTLNIIGKASVLKDTEKSLELIEAISLIMRYTLEHTDDLVTLDEELEIIRAYLFIQQTRFASRLEYEIRVEPEAGSVPIPPVILQPLIENSIKYGLEASKEALKIRVIATRTNDSLSIAVIDNGSRTQAEERAPLPGLGIGLHNLKRRLSLRYGRDDLLKITKREERGTEVSIILPGVLETQE